MITVTVTWLRTSLKIPCGASTAHGVQTQLCSTTQATSQVHTGIHPQAAAAFRSKPPKVQPTLTPQKAAAMNRLPALLLPCWPLLHTVCSKPFPCVQQTSPKLNDTAPAAAAGKHPPDMPTSHVQFMTEGSADTVPGRTSWLPLRIQAQANTQIIPLPPSPLHLPPIYPPPIQAQALGPTVCHSNTASSSGTVTHHTHTALSAHPCSAPAASCPSSASWRVAAAPRPARARPRAL